MRTHTRTGSLGTRGQQKKKKQLLFFLQFLRSMKYLFCLQPENIFFFSGLGWRGKQVVRSYTTVIAVLVCRCGGLAFPWPALCPVRVVPFFFCVLCWDQRSRGRSALEPWLRRFSFAGVTSQLFRKLHSRRPNPKVGSDTAEKARNGSAGELLCSSRQFSSLFRSSSRVS